jgi:ABC-type Fe3+-hydroxamate transport system substrate-binding protein
VKTLGGLLAATGLVLTSCAGDAGTQSAAPPAPTATVTVTATATETVTVPPGPTVEDLAGDASLDDLIERLDDVPTPSPPPKLKLRVYSDGCGVIRSTPAPGTSYDNLTWSVLDEGGFQVLGRNAEGETRYRYFQGGTYTVVLEAFVNGGYRPVSNTVTVHC